MKKNVVLAMAAVMATGVTGVTAAKADEGPLEVRVRMLYLDPANNSDAFSPLAIPENAVRINSKGVPEVDFEYYFSRNWSSELILTYPQKQTVTVEKSALGGPTSLGSFRHLPPILTIKYGFTPDSDFRPYVGVGVNITYISDVDLTVPTVGKLDLSHWSVGPAAQLGADYKIGNRCFLNADIKWALLHANVDLGTTHVTQLQINPLLFGVGVGYRF